MRWNFPARKNIIFSENSLTNFLKVFALIELMTEWEFLHMVLVIGKKNEIANKKAY